MSETIVITETLTETLEITSPGVPGPTGEGVPAGGTTGQALVKASNADFDTEWGAGGGGASALVDLTDVSGGPPATGEAPVWDGDSFELTDVLTAAEAAAGYQPLDADLTAVAALTTTAFGRALLELANQAALLSAAGAAATVHAHAGEDITSGTVADARIAATIARDSEVTSAISALSTVYQPLDADLTAVAALTTTAFGRALLELADAAAARAALDLEPGTDVVSQSAFQAHLDDTADAHDASAISILDTANDFTATDVEGALAELQSDHETDAQNLADHLADATAAHAASAIAFTPDGSIAATTVQAAIVEVRDEAAGGAPTDVDYLVGTASGGLSAEIVVGTSPGGELGGTWASPTVDATHSGSSHAAVQAAAEATAAAALSAHVSDVTDAHDASAVSVDSTTLVGTGTDVQAVLEELDNAVAAAYTPGGTDVALADGGTGASLADPGADRIMFWDDSAGAVTWLTAGTNLTITDTTIAASGSGGGAAADDESLILHMAVFA